MDLAYEMFIAENIHMLLISDDTYPKYPEIWFTEASLLESLYRESNIALPGHHFQNQFINYYKVLIHFPYEDNSDSLRLFPNHPIYCPSRVFAFSEPLPLQLGEMKKHHDIKDSVIFICSHEQPKQPKFIFNICCSISENQQVAQLIMSSVTFLHTTEPCTLKISEKIFRIIMCLVFMPIRVMVQLMETISQASRVDYMEIEHTPLDGVKSFNLENKASSLLHLHLQRLEMDKDLCASFLKQIQSLTKLKFLIIRSLSRYGPFAFTFLPESRGYKLEGNEGYCHIPRDMYSELLRSISHFHHLVHLDVSGYNLAGCLPNLVSDLDSGMHALQRLYLENTTLTSNDANHITHIIETRKLRKLDMLNLDWNNSCGVEDEIDRLFNTIITYHQRELEVTLIRDSFPQQLVNKWETQYSGTLVKLHFSYSEVQKNYLDKI